MIFRASTATLISIAAVALSACAITSEGLEFKVQPEVARATVSFAWRSRDDHSGTLTASLPDGRVFSGPYVWITAETPSTDLVPLWQGWRAQRGWRQWQPGPEFANYYRGETLASLRATNGELMRCRFRALDRSSGMNGGGEGTCQRAGRRTFDAAFAAAQPS